MTGIIATLFGKVSPSYISHGSNLQDSGETAGLASVPSGEVTSDFLLTLCCSARAGGVTWTDGVADYTERVDQGAQPSLRISTKTDHGAEDVPNVVASVAAVDNDTILAFYQLRFRAGRYDTIGTAATTTGNGTLTLPAITSAGGLALAIVVARPATTVSTPADFVQIINETTRVMRVAVFSKVVQPGTTGDIDTTIGSIDGTAAGILLGLQ